MQLLQFNSVSFTVQILNLPKSGTKVILGNDGKKNDRNHGKEKRYREVQKRQKITAK